jgi:hypothetical protein
MVKWFTRYDCLLKKPEFFQTTRTLFKFQKELFHNILSNYSDQTSQYSRVSFFFDQALGFIVFSAQFQINHD